MTAETILAEIAEKRRRQIEVHGYTPRHDDSHPGDMAEAAACYAMVTLFPMRYHRDTPDQFYKGGRHGADLECRIPPPDGEGAPHWPWEEAAWRPTDPRDDLIKAATLIVAEIERLDRAAPVRDASPSKVEPKAKAESEASGGCNSRQPGPQDSASDVLTAAKNYLESIRVAKTLPHDACLTRLTADKQALEAAIAAAEGRDA